MNEIEIVYPGGGNDTIRRVEDETPIELDTGQAESTVNASELGDIHGQHWGSVPWPEWMVGFRGHQIEAIERCVEAFERGAKVVWLDAPTGSGKTIIGEGVRRRLGERALYVCSGKSLQDQFARDFPYSRVLKGRNNYPTGKAPYPYVSCADCNKEKGVDDSCSWCPSVRECNYEVAKVQAHRADVAVLNTTYLLYESNHIGTFSKQKLIIADECDMLESELMRFIEWRISGKWLSTLGMTCPVKGARKATILSWLENVVEELRRHYGTYKGDMDDVKMVRERSTCERLGKGAVKLLETLRDDMDGAEAGTTDGWGFVRDYDRGDEGAFVLKPVKVDRYGEELLWNHSERWLCMSATIISAQEQAESLGLVDGEWELVTVPMTFPVHHRPIIKWPVANMTKRTHEEEYPKLVDGLCKVFEVHPDDNILVHTVSYALTRDLANEFRKWPRNVHSYLSSQNRDSVLEAFRMDGGILFAASADRGIDLPDDLCRCVVVAKTPFASLGDRVVSERIHSEGGQVWYQVQTVRTIIQMTGRGVRSEDDHCVTYILDKQFESQIWKGCGYLLPEWWKEGVRYGVGCEEAKAIRRR